MVEQVEHHNLLLGIVVNGCVVIPKLRAMPIILINTNKFNVWVRHLLLAAELYDADKEEVKHRSTMDQEGDEIKIGFQPVPSISVNINTNQGEAGPIQPTNPNIE